MENANFIRTVNIFIPPIFTQWNLLKIMFEISEKCEKNPCHNFCHKKCYLKIESVLKIIARILE